MLGEGVGLLFAEEGVVDGMEEYCSSGDVVIYSMIEECPEECFASIVDSFRAATSFP